MKKWKYFELSIMSPSPEMTILSIGLVKEIAVATDYSESKKIDIKKVGSSITKLGADGWEMVSSTESIMPNGWLRTRWIFKREI